MACEHPIVCVLPFCHPLLSATGLALAFLCHDAHDSVMPSLCQRCPVPGCVQQAGRQEIPGGTVSAEVLQQRSTAKLSGEQTL